jgi:predicted RNA-binding protein YlqC (UPF0109 family)
VRAADSGLGTVALARIKLGDAVTALRTVVSATEGALEEIRRKFPDITDQPNDVRIARCELNRATAVVKVYADHVNAALARLGGEPQVRTSARNIMERV